MLRVLLFIFIISVSVTELLGQWVREDVSGYLGWIQETKIGEGRTDGIMRVYTAESSLSEYTYTASGIDKSNLSNDMPRKIIFNQNYPNPFNPKTIINYELRITDYVELIIYNVLGQKMATLVSKLQPAGYYSYEWDAIGFASGIYLYQLSTGSPAHRYVQSKKMILIR